MHYFLYRNNEFYCERKRLVDIAQDYGTPLYVYSSRTIVEHYEKIKKAFSCLTPLICYSVKANSNLSILKLLVKRGAGLDIVSGGELYRAKLVGCKGEKIVYASVGKTEEEIETGINNRILMFNVESLSELIRINNIAKKLKKIVAVAIRVNPDIKPRTHSYITTGKKDTKFGVDIETARMIFTRREEFTHIKLAGIHLHIGSQIVSALPFLRAIKRVIPLIKELKKKNNTLKYFNIGGGLGIVYDKEKPQTAEEFARDVIPLLKGLKLKIILEPGRFIMGNAGVLLTRVLYIKSSYNKQFIIVDAGMNDLLRPAIYNAYHRVLPLKKQRGYKGASVLADVVGPICESGDFLAKGRSLKVNEGDYLAVLGAGAYGFSMSSNYNSRPRAAEVLIKDNKVYLIRKRETLKDLVNKEVLVPRLS